jgi:hypothetical protein
VVGVLPERLAVGQDDEVEPQVEGVDDQPSSWRTIGRSKLTYQHRNSPEEGSNRWTTLK